MIFKTRVKNLLKIRVQIKYAIIFIGIVAVVTTTYAGAIKFISFMNDPVGTYVIASVNVRQAKADVIYSRDMSVQDKIRFYAGIYGVNPDDALRVAMCESNFDPNAENINGSATGVYQWIRKSWKSNNCGNDVYNADQNIICFLQLYPEHPEMWECK